MLFVLVFSANQYADSDSLYGYGAMSQVNRFVFCPQGRTITGRDNFQVVVRHRRARGAQSF
jgi:hypothetical protein